MMNCGDQFFHELQVLCRPGVVERFLPEFPEVCTKVRDTFAGLWGLEGNNKETRDIIAVRI